jgi:hypothetical protein
VPPRGKTIFSIAFNPTYAGPLSVTVMVETDDPDIEVFLFTVEGYGSPIPVPDIYIKRGETGIASGYLGCDFGTVLLGESSIPEMFILENNGTAELSIFSVSILSGALSDFSIDDSILNYSVAPGGSTAFSVTFSPTDVGERDALVTIAHNDFDGDPYVFIIKGSGEPKIPDIYIEVGSVEIPESSVGHDFGAVTIDSSSTPVTITIGNRGTEVLNIPDISSSDPIQFSINEMGRLFSLPPGDTLDTSFAVTFNPNNPEGIKSADITITSDDPDTPQYTFTLIGSASPIPIPYINVKRGSTGIPKGTLGYDFGPIQIGSSSSPVSFTIENIGTANLTVLGISSSASEFTIGNSPLFPFDLSESGYDTFSITFSPSVLGQATEVISIFTNDPDDNPFTFTVQGEAALPDINVRKSSTPIPNGTPDAHDFGTVLIGDSSSPVVFNIENNGDGDLIVNSIAFNSGDIFDFTYNDSSMSYTVAPGGSTSFTVTFNPTASGQRLATMYIYNNDPDADPYTFSVAGYGEPKEPDIHIMQGSTNFPAGSTYDFGVELLGSSSAVQFTIRNLGTADLTVSDINSSSSEFIITSAPSMPFTIAPMTNKNGTIAFYPATSGPKTATITIVSNDPDAFETPYTFTVQGVGETPVPVINVRQGTTALPNGTGIYFFGFVAEGDSKLATFTIDNDGTASLIISGILATGGDTDQFLIDYSIPPIDPGNSDTFTITFSPTFPTDKWATITVVSNDPNDDLYTFRVEGMVGLPPVVDIEVWEGITYYPDGSTYNGFGSINVGFGSTPVAFTIWNNGPDDLIIPNIVITGGDIGDFNLDFNSTDLNTPIPPGWSTTFSSTFVPQSSGNKWLELDINYNDPVQTPYQLRLEGIGED